MEQRKEQKRRWKKVQKGEKKQKSIRRRILFAAVTGIGVFLAAAAVYVIYVIADYKRIPDYMELTIEKAEETETSETSETSKASELIREDTVYTVLTYNLGFGAYSPEYSFFMDGGKYSWALSKEEVRKNITGACGQIRDFDPELILLQEVDEDATRSYHVNEKEWIEESFEKYDTCYARNFDSAFLCYPFYQPHGKTRSGILTCSRFSIEAALRRSLPVSDGFGKYVDLDRCYSVQRILAENGKDLVVFNVHLSAYGSDDSVRAGQIAMIKEDMSREIAAGNYVICGGDFNHDLLNYEETAEEVPGWAYPFPRSELPEGVSFAMDCLSEKDKENLHLSARNADIPYSEDCYTVMLDGFLISDNIELVSYECVDTGYAFSDHEPVVMQFRLSAEEK